MPTLDRMVAGMRCREVLAELSDFVDNALPEERAAQIQAHVQDCDWCERFGGEFAAVVKSFRLALAVADPIDPGIERRLRERMRRELTAGGA